MKALWLAFAFSLATTPLVAKAIKLLPECATTRDTKLAGNCGISDLLSVFANFAEILLGISGALALGFFVWGGFQIIASAGNKDRVTKGKNTLVQATIGIFIIFLSGVIVRFTSEALTGQAANICLAVGTNTGVFTVDGTAQGAPCLPKLGDTCEKTESLGKCKSQDQCVTIMGGTLCDDGTCKSYGGLWISIPAGFSDPKDPGGTYIPESLVCIKKTHSVGKDGCEPLNKELGDKRNRKQDAVFECMSTSEPDAARCVRGLCGGSADFACCIRQKN